MKVIAFSDTHFPFHNQLKLNKIYKIIEKEKPDVVIHCGDIYDNYMFSRFDKDFNVIKPKDELSIANTKGIYMWHTIKKLAPEAKLIQLLGNHCQRVARSIMRSLPSLASEIVSLREKYYTFDGVKVMSSDREYIELDGVIYCHGWHNSCVMHMRHFKKPCVHGHRHHPDLIHEPLSKTDYIPMWELDVGCLCDQKKVPFDYTNSIQTNWKSAVGIITDGVPRLIII